MASGSNASGSNGAAAVTLLPQGIIALYTLLPQGIIALYYRPWPQHFLYFLPLPQGQASLRPILRISFLN
jgi:hypothetical protein